MVKFRADKEIEEIVEPILKYFIVAFNLLSFLIGIISICGGAWLLYQYDKAIGSDSNFASVYDLSFDLGVYLLIVGIICVIITSFAIAATYRENIFVLRLYMIILTFVIIFNLVIGVTFLIFSGKITTTITEKLQTNYITDYFEDDLLKSVYDSLQGSYECCGITDYQDWNTNPYFNCSSTASSSTLKCLVPASCCYDYTSATNTFCSGRVLTDTSLDTINKNGCADIIIDKASYGISVVSGCCIGLSVFFVVNVGLVQWLILLTQKEKALYNSKHNPESGDYKELVDQA